MTAPFHLDTGGARLTLNPGPWGVALRVETVLSPAGITMTAEEATRVAAALILAAATVASYADPQPAQSEGCPHCAMFDRPCDCQQFLAPPAPFPCACGGSGPCASCSGDRTQAERAQSEEPADWQANYRAWLESRGPYPAR